MHRRLIPLTTVVVITLAACGDDQPATSPTDEPSTVVAPTTAPTTTSTTNESETTAPRSTPATEVPMTTTPSESSVDFAIADLAERVAVEPDEIEVVSVDEVTWRDGSLGCPEPGRVYTQALVNGQRIVLAVDGIDYEYHSGGSRSPFYCPPDRVVAPSDSPDPGV